MTADLRRLNINNWISLMKDQERWQKIVAQAWFTMDCGRSRL